MEPQKASHNFYAVTYAVVLSAAVSNLLLQEKAQTFRMRWVKGIKVREGITSMRISQVQKYKYECLIKLNDTLTHTDSYVILMRATK